MKINPYLNFPGTTEEAFNFYKSVFGGEFSAINRFRETPEAEKLSESDKDKLMHIALPIGKDITLMATDALESMGHSLTVGNNVYLSIETDTREEADNLFGKLSDGGTVEVPMDDMFWGSYFGSVKDKFGIGWMIDYTPAKEN